MKLKEIPVVFDQEKHTYQNTENGDFYKGITGTLINHLFPSKYSGVPEDVLRKAAERGTAVHEEMELMESIGIEPFSEEGKNYLLLKKEYGLKSVATEYTVSDLQHFATNIDVIYEEGEDTVSIGDYKTTYKIDHESVSWQLSICSYFLRLNNPNVKVAKLYSIWLRGEKCEITEEHIHSDEEVERLISSYLADKPYMELQDTDDAALIKRIVDLQNEMKVKSAELDVLKENLMERMTNGNVYKIDREDVLITRTKPSIRKSFDSKSFKADHSDLYDQYMKESETASTLKITLR